ncbi:MAG: hypothetical protein AAF533_08900 [Acidobacteriota bacterium]
MRLACSCFVVTFLISGPSLAETTVPAAMLTVRIAATTPADRPPATTVWLGPEELRELERGLLRLEAGNRGEPVVLPGLGAQRDGTILTAPRIYAEESSPASIEVRQDIPMGAPGGEVILVRLRWTREGDRLAQLEVDADVQGTPMGGSLSLQVGETALLTTRRGTELLLLAVTLDSIQG